MQIESPVTVARVTVTNDVCKRRALLVTTLLGQLRANLAAYDACLGQFSQKGNCHRLKQWSAEARALRRQVGILKFFVRNCPLGCGRACNGQCRHQSEDGTCLLRIS